MLALSPLLATTLLLPVSFSAREQMVLLHCTFRSGSSLLGELFNYNPDTFYVFEPLYGAVQSLHVTVLEDIANTCSSKYWGLKDRSFSFHDNNTVFSRCLFQKILAIKTIRLRGASHLPSLWTPNVRVIHLIRDPRAVLHSRLQYTRLHSGGRVFSKSVAGVGEAARVLCDQFVRDGEYLTREYRGKSLTVKFEDLAENTLQIAQEIYSFLETTVPKQLYDWIGTLSSPRSEPREPWRSTHQDADRVLRKWETGLSPDMICAVETSCVELMRLYQYPARCI